MLVLHVKFKEVITIGNDMVINVSKNNDKSLMFELKGPKNTFVVADYAVKEANKENVFLFKIHYDHQVFINNSIRIKIFRMNTHTNFKLCIDAPREISIFREKVRKKMNINRNLLQIK